jgi:hypothetical protein
MALKAFKVKRNYFGIPFSTKGILRATKHHFWFLLGALGSFASIYAIVDWQGMAIFAVVGFLIMGYFVIGALYRIGHLEEQLAAELPLSHSFLVEFLRSTYIASGESLIIEKNRGLNITKYVNNFEVRGSDCRNVQTISGRNISKNPLCGLAFALVGGSSMKAENLNSHFTTHDGMSGKPEFLLDNERIKVAFCKFRIPLEPNSEFKISYSDNWKGAMRQDSDGFFFPEAVFFQGRIGEISVTLDFDAEVESLASLEFNVENSNVRTCRSQPQSIKANSGFSNSFEWKTVFPKSRSIFILYYSIKKISL